MPHKCVRCGAIYDDNDEVVLKGCPKCGSRLFFFIRKDIIEEDKEVMEKVDELTKNLDEESIIQIEEDIREIIAEQEEEQEEEDKPIILDVESIFMPEPGKYELNLEKLFKKQPLVFKLEDGKYVIDLKNLFRKE